MEIWTCTRILSVVSKLNFLFHHSVPYRKSSERERPKGWRCICMCRVIRYSDFSDMQSMATEHEKPNEILFLVWKVYGWHVYRSSHIHRHRQLEIISRWKCYEFFGSANTNTLSYTNMYTANMMDRGLLQMGRYEHTHTGSNGFNSKANGKNPEQYKFSFFLL